MIERKRKENRADFQSFVVCSRCFLLRYLFYWPFVVFFFSLLHLVSLWTLPRDIGRRVVMVVGVDDNNDDYHVCMYTCGYVLSTIVVRGSISRYQGRVFIFFPLSDYQREHTAFFILTYQ